MNEEYSFFLSSHIAVVTGGASGLGKAICDGFCASGAMVVILDIDRKKGEIVKEELCNRYGKLVEYFLCDITNETAVKKTFENINNTIGIPDILVNSAGINYQRPAEKMLMEDWNRIISVNLTGTFITCKSFGLNAIKRKKGSIINIASMSGLIVNRGRRNSAYCASKGGVIMYTKAIASEWSQYGLRANAIAPGYFRTPFNEKWINNMDIYNQALANTPLNRLGEPKEIVPLVLFLSSEASSFVTGAVFSIDGGYTIW